jgi:hypothetical protein
MSSCWRRRGATQKSEWRHCRAAGWLQKEAPPEFAWPACPDRMASVSAALVFLRVAASQDCGNCAGAGLWRPRGLDGQLAGSVAGAQRQSCVTPGLLWGSGCERAPCCCSGCAGAHAPLAPRLLPAEQLGRPLRQGAREPVLDPADLSTQHGPRPHAPVLQAGILDARD